MDGDLWWLVIGFGGQALFMARFVVQWLLSERERRSVIPVSFWYFSIVGALVLLVYALHQRDPVFIAGQLLGVGIYVRNLHLIRLERAEARRTPN
ncbi:lipid-A-disaccharide synthase N-terminal domain-containing protein [Massilia terrae]|uniref:Lipid-A-disaccharide synthase N-terminal domain-containing protein n=1 Tax=Massilia terrae TaxID=1811224 RepID=A0ABT2CUN4_9BURK|nr:lipid-A-disaccharide synthase N-terminal domain-containing protein [Massilia terrae]MCS0657691.1 lipid-A-disaccharide synthase N-terminal domain-containing protein [Massilia terrae]